MGYRLTASVVGCPACISLTGLVSPVQNGMSVPSLSSLLTDTKVVALDWNGTTVDDIDRALRATNFVLAHRKMPTLDLAEFRETFVLPMHRYFEVLGIAPTEIDAANEEWSKASAAESADLSRGIVRLLKVAESMNLPVGIISAASSDLVLSDAYRLGIADQLSFVHGNTTSKSAVLLDLASHHGGKVLYCGDTEYDISEALIANAVAVAFSGGYRPAPALVAAGAEYVIDSFDTLASALLSAG